MLTFSNKHLQKVARNSNLEEVANETAPVAPGGTKGSRGRRDLPWFEVIWWVQDLYSILNQTSQFAWDHSSVGRNQNAFVFFQFSDFPNERNSFYFLGHHRIIVNVIQEPMCRKLQDA